MTAHQRSTSKDDILAVLQNATREVLGDATPSIAIDSTLGSDGLGIDSLDLIEIMMEVEARLSIELDKVDVEGIRTVDGLVSVIELKLSTVGM